MPVDEAASDETPFGRYITSDGWFVLNLEEALAVRNTKGGSLYPLEARVAPFRDFGVNVRVLRKGEPNGLYHAESGQEAFLVLSGECTLLVEEQERRLRRWDFFHCPAGTRHIFVGTEDEPCVVLMIGLRPEQESLHYPVSEVAARYGASAERETSDPDLAYANWPRGFEPVRLPWPPETA